jgi:hypothetical protein
MNDGVKILLERIKTYPEEFTGGKWNALIQSHKMFLNKEDCEALDVGLNALMQQQFTEKVLEELVDPKKSDSWVDKVLAQKGTLAVGTTLGQSWVNTQLQQAQAQAQHSSTVAHMKAHLEVLEMAKKAEVKKEVKTLFGRLFNYS